MTRQTSIECYQAIKNNDIISTSRLDVILAIAKLSPCTSAEAHRYLKFQKGKSYFISSVRARITELQEMKIINVRPARECSVTGRNSLTWELSGNTKPKPFQRKTKQTAQALLNAIRSHMNKAGQVFISLPEIEQFANKDTRQ